MVIAHPPEVESERRDEAHAPDGGVIEEARARQRRHRNTALVATLAAAILAIGLAFVGGGRGSHGRAGSGLPTPSLAAARFRNVSGAPCVWKPTTSGTPSRSLLSILGVFRGGTTPVHAAPGLLSQPNPGLFGEEVYADYIRQAGVFAGSPTYLYIVDDTGCSPIPAHGELLKTKRRWLGDNVDIARPGVREQGGSNGGAVAIESGQWVWLGAPGINGLTAQSETVTLLVPDQVASVSIRYPTEAVEPAYHKHPGPIVPALTINAKPINNLVMFNVHHHSSAAMAPLTMTWRATDGHIIKTFHRL